VKSHDFPDLYRRAADYVDKILRGAKPGGIPVRLEHSLSMGVVNESGRVAVICCFAGDGNFYCRSRYRGTIPRAARRNRFLRGPPSNTARQRGLR